jgi:NAD(P)-dependent dehydrogenase (short-subunit alcohol dehydrogenase family)
MNRTILITGASKGLGRTLAGFLGSQGDELILTARNETELNAAAAELRRGNDKIHAIPGDVADPDHRKALIRKAAELGGLDLLINNASALGPSPLPDLVDLPADEFRRILEVNLIAPLELVREALSILKPSGGLVVNVSSDAALGGYEGWGGYGASKAALDLVSLTLANELRPAGIGVVSVDPGDLNTEMHQAAYPGVDISDRPDPGVTLPFWAWLFGQEPLDVSGTRFQAQSERCLVGA